MKRLGALLGCLLLIPISGCPDPAVPPTPPAPQNQDKAPDSAPKGPGELKEDPPAEAQPAKLMGELPLVAVWMSFTSRIPGKAGISGLRVAIWADGRALFKDSPADWSSSLRFGRLEESTLAKLKADLAKTGVFDLKGHCYLVPDAPMMCVLANVDGRQQLLYWDEVESPRYGINIDPKPRHLAFKKAWHAVNALALSLRPPNSKSSPWVGDDPKPPAEWYVKKAIQSR